MLVDIGRLEELKGSRAAADGGWEVGALTTYTEALEATELDFTRDCILGIGDVQVRNRARSVGRSTTPTRRPTCRRSCSLSTTRPCCGRRGATGPCRSTGSSRVPSRPASHRTRSRSSSSGGPLAAGAKGSYLKMAHPASGYSIVGVCAVVASSGGAVSHARIGMQRRRRGGLSSEGCRVGADGQRRIAERGRRGRGPCRGRADRQQRHLCRSRLSIEDGGGLYRRTVDAALGR